MNGKVEKIYIKNENLQYKSSDSIIYKFNKKGLPEIITYYGLGFNAVFEKLVNEEDGEDWLTYYLPTTSPEIASPFCFGPLLFLFIQTCCAAIKTVLKNQYREQEKASMQSTEA